MGTHIFVEKAGSAPRHLARIAVCRSFSSRLRGLMFRKEIPPQEGLLLIGSRDSRLDAAIHMFFVPFDLGVLWIDSEMTVVGKVLAKPWRPFYAPARPARFILEMHPALLAEYAEGEKVEFVDA